MFTLDLDRKVFQVLSALNLEKHYIPCHTWYGFAS